MARASRGKPGKAHSNRKPINRIRVSLACNASFKGEGLRPFFVYRDLGIKEATGGRVGAQVIRASRPCVEGTGRHRHLAAVRQGRVTAGRPPCHAASVPLSSHAGGGGAQQQERSP